MIAWRDFEAELAAWAEAGLTPTLWWRDDDAVAQTSALDRLLAITDAIPVMLLDEATPGPSGVGADVSGA